MAKLVLFFVALVSGALQPGGAAAAAILIPDHPFRLGSCGGPQGRACTWACGVGRSCSADSACSVHGRQAFGAVVSVKVDNAPCGASPGSILTVGLAAAGSNPFQATPAAFDLC